MHDDTADTLVSLASTPLTPAERERLEEIGRQLWAELDARAEGTPVPPIRG